MSCKNCVSTDCACRRESAVNIFSKDYKAGVRVGGRLQRDRTFDALIELESRKIISNAQMQAVFDLILEKLTDAVDID
jgi:hypothetical protein